MAALLTSICDSQEKVVKYIDDAKRMGMVILPPDVNQSQYGFINEGENAIRYGLGSIKGVGYINIESLIQSRPYNSLSDLISRTEKKAVNKKVVTALTMSGSLDSLTTPKEDLVERYIEIVEEESPPSFRHRLDILQHIYKLREDKDELDVDNFTTQDELQHEVGLLGMYLSRHPLDGIAEPINWNGIWHNERFDCIAIIMDYRVIKTKNGNDMAFVDIESLEGRRNLVVFPKTYNKVKGKLKKEQTLVFTIQKQYRGEEDSYIVQNIRKFETS